MAAIHLRVPVLCVALALGGTVVNQPSTIGNSQTHPKKQHTQDTVPNPKEAEIRRIRTAEEWKNPYIVVYSDAFELVLGHGGDAIRRRT